MKKDITSLALRLSDFWPDIQENWRYRDLLFFMTWRDIKVRYKQTAIGFLWTIIQPLATMVAFSLFLGSIGKLPSNNIPYPVFVLTGLLPWFFLANCLNASSHCIAGNQNLITKVYFPRLIMPLSSVLACVFDFFISLGLLAIALVWSGITPTASILLIPLLIFLMVAAAIGITTIFSALSAAYRDFRYIIPFTTQIWMFATPSIYMHTGEKKSLLFEYVLPLNVAHGIIENFRAAVLGGNIEIYSLAVSGTLSIVLFAAGYSYFCYAERSFADII